MSTHFRGQRGHRRRLSLAGQYLVLQLLIVVAVLAGVVAISLAQSAEAFQRDEGRRVLSAAESLAATPVVRTLLPGAEPRLGAALAAATESVRSVSGASIAALATEDLRVVTSSDPDLLGKHLEIGESRILDGRAWTGVVRMAGVEYLVAHVPALDDEGHGAGIAVVGRAYPTVWERLVDAVPNLLAYLGVSLALGTAGSLLLSYRVKRQTLGMEPGEIANLVEHREAILHGVKEGVVSLDPHQRITVANDAARHLLRLPPDCVGRSLDELRVDPAVRAALTTEQGEPDRLVLVGERVVVANRQPMHSRGRVIGAVTTLRDRTELSTLERELGATRTATDTLRAQTHEFANQLHTISGLIQLGEYNDVVKYVDGVSLSRTQLYDDVTRKVHEPAVSALLIAKASLAAERGVALGLAEGARLARADDDALARDLTTVVGNLVDNAIDAVTGLPGGRVTVGLSEEGGEIRVTVRDSGPGVQVDRVEDIFRQGFSTKASAAESGRGFGLALTRLVCLRRAGDVSVGHDGGAVFTARLQREAVRSP